MTFNIVAQFASSVWKNSEEERAEELGFNVGDFKEYPVVSGSIFNEEYNETLDSASIVLSQIVKQDRLCDLKPYEYVRVYDKSGQTDFDQLYLIDTFNETENNIKDNIFGYTINLMSETKWLEKIQCPNLTITHKLNEDGSVKKKTILQYIHQYLELYVPKMKFSDDNSTWSYKPLITIDDTINYSDNLSTQNLTDQDFTADGFVWKLETDTSAIPSNIDLNTVEFLPYQIIPNSYNQEATIPTFLNFSYEFNETTRTFHIVGTVVRNAFNPTPLPDTLDFFIIFPYTYISYDNVSEKWKKFAVPCADLAFTAPTLRQLLTTLMLQVGCIPTVKNRVLGYLDFQLDSVPFGGGTDYKIGNTVNYITRGLSSDSYANTLVNISENVLDSGNEVISETLGFRDKNSVLLKQAENLYLETSFPIYKVNKCILHAPGKFTCIDTLNDLGSMVISSSYNCLNFGANAGAAPDVNYPFIYYRDTGISNNKATIIFNATSQNVNYYIRLSQIHFMKRDANNDYKIIESRSLSSFTMNSDNLVHRTISWNNGQYIFNNVYSVTLEINNVSNDATGFWFQGYADNRRFIFVHFDDNDSRVRYGAVAGVTSALSANFENAASAGLLISEVVGFRNWDITQLIKESSERSLLDRNFDKMANLQSQDRTIENISKYVYGTVEYSIGSKQITGFSETWIQGESTSLGWITKERTYLENIINVLSSFDQRNTNVQDLFAVHFAGIPVIFGYSSGVSYPAVLNQGTFIDAAFSFFNPNTPTAFFSSGVYFSTFFVDIYYQPLNTFNLAYTKSIEDIDVPIAQYDSNTSGLTDFDRLSIHEQEQVDRIGNEVLTINQRTPLFNQIQTFKNGPLMYLDDTNRSGQIGIEDNGVKYIVFKRTFTINNNCFNASYTASKDAILKNYFTSIRTKYRAYQYVDYNQSVLRKERDTIFVRIADESYYDGDDKIWIGNYTSRNNNDTTYWIYDINNNLTQKNAISYECEHDIGLIYDNDNNEIEELQTIKNSVAVVSTTNMLGVIYEYTDNMGAGTYLYDVTKDAHLGGIPQSWQIWHDNYSTKHTVTYVNYIDFYSHFEASNMTDEIKKIERSPIVDSDYLNLNTSSNVVFSLVDDNKATIDNTENAYRVLRRTFYKDYAERINHSVQFIYYAPNNNVLFGEDFVSGAPLMSKFVHEFNTMYGTDVFEINTYAHEVPNNSQGEPEDLIADKSDGLDFYEDYLEFTTVNGRPVLKIIWKPYDNKDAYEVIKLCHRQANGEVVDIAVFKRPDGNPKYTNFYFTLNDTKTDYVLSEQNGILYRKYKVATNTSERNVAPLEE